MADVKKTMDVVVAAKGTETAKRKLGGVEKSIGSMAKKALVGVASFYALKKALDFTVAASIRQENIFRKLQTSVELVGKKWGGAKTELDGLFAKLQATTQYGDTESAGVLTTLIQLTSDYQKSVKALPMALDLAATGLFDANTAAKYVAMALKGNVQMLGRYIPELRAANNEIVKNGTASEKTAEFLRIFNEKFTGTAQKNLESTGARLKQLRNYLGDIGEAIGDKTLPAAIGLIKTFTSFIKSVKPKNFSDITAELKNMGIELDIVNDINKEIRMNDLLTKRLDIEGKIAGSKLTEASAKAIITKTTMDQKNVLEKTANIQKDYNTFLENYGFLKTSEDKKDQLRYKLTKEAYENRLTFATAELSTIANRISKERDEAAQYLSYLKQRKLLEELIANNGEKAKKPDKTNSDVAKQINERIKQTKQLLDLNVSGGIRGMPGSPMALVAAGEKEELSAQSERYQQWADNQKSFVNQQVGLYASYGRQIGQSVANAVKNGEDVFKAAAKSMLDIGIDLLEKKFLEAQASAILDTIISGGVLSFSSAAKVMAGYAALEGARVAVDSWQIGTPYVQRTGPAIVHEGERILSLNDNRSLVETMNRIDDKLSSLNGGGNYVINAIDSESFETFLRKGGNAVIEKQFARGRIAV